MFSLPLLLSAQAGMSGGLVSALLGLAATSASCFLFGVVYRWVRRCLRGAACPGGHAALGQRWLAIAYAMAGCCGGP